VGKNEPRSADGAVTGVMGVDVLVESGQKSVRQVVDRWLQDCPPARGPQGTSWCPREDLDFTLYRSRNQGNQSPILAIALAAEQSPPQSLRRLEREYSLAAELDAHSTC
jgi:hypothetical protein